MSFKPIDDIFASIRFSWRKFDVVRIELSELSVRDVCRLKNILEFHGATVKNLELIITSSSGMSESDFIEILNYMPMLHQLKMVIWERSLILDNSALQRGLLYLFHLKKLEFFGSATTVLKILTHSLPRHTLVDFKFDGKQYLFHIWNNFINTQLAIKKLDLSGHFNDAQPFRKLQLTHLRVVFRDEYSKSYQNFLKNFIKSQPELSELDLLCLTHCRCMKANSDVLNDICQLKNLKSLKLNIDEISSWKIQTVSQLRNIKTLELDAICESSLSTVGKLSLINNFEVENLAFKFTKYEISSTFYKQIGRNFQNLKSLEVSFDVKHKINFFMKNFPNLDSLKVVYGESVVFADVYDDDGLTNLKWKKLSLRLDEKKIIKIDLFFKMRIALPNLVKLEIYSKFPFSSAFLYELTGNIHGIKSLCIGSFSVRNVEKFPDLVIEVLKHLRRKLRFTKIILRNIQNLSRNSVAITNDPRHESCDARDPMFTYLPLVNSLRDFYDIKAIKKGQHKIYRNLELTHGSEEDIFEEKLEKSTQKQKFELGCLFHAVNRIL